MSKELPEEVLNAVLSVCDQCSQVLGKIAESHYYLQIAATHSHILQKLFCLILNPNEAPVESNIIGDLTELNGKILSQLDAFLQAAKYNLNYLEQYFEHEFCEDLERSTLKEQSKTILEALTRSA
jgi:hypothetical protein